jgi:hypothetical protein
VSDQELHEELLRLYNAAGRPATRSLARRTAGGISHTSVADYLRGELRRLDTLESIVTALGGDVTWFRSKWVEGLDEGQEAPPGPPTRRVTVDVLEEILAELRALREALERSWGPGAD